MGRIRGKRNRDQDRYTQMMRRSQQAGMVSANVPVCSFCGALTPSDDAVLTLSEVVCRQCAVERGLLVPRRIKSSGDLSTLSAIDGFGYSDFSGGPGGTAKGTVIVRTGALPQESRAEQAQRRAERTREQFDRELTREAARVQRVKLSLQRDIERAIAREQARIEREQAHALRRDARIQARIEREQARIFRSEEAKQARIQRQEFRTAMVRQRQLENQIKRDARQEAVLRRQLAREYVAVYRREKWRLVAALAQAERRNKRQLLALQARIARLQGGVREQRRQFLASCDEARAKWRERIFKRALLWLRRDKSVSQKNEADTAWAIAHIGTINEARTAVADIRARVYRQTFKLRKHEVPRKLTVEQVQAIRNRYAAGGVSQYALAEEFAVTQGTINLVVTGSIYRDAGGPLHQVKPQRSRFWGTYERLRA